jgi:hypothetical protein
MFIEVHTGKDKNPQLLNVGEGWLCEPMTTVEYYKARLTNHGTGEQYYVWETYTQLKATLGVITSPAPPSEAIGLLTQLLDHVDSIVCPHERTYRGGVIWEICCDCNAKWADDEGGKPPPKDHPRVAAARNFLNNV